MVGDSDDEIILRLTLLLGIGQPWTLIMILKSKVPEKVPVALKVLLEVFIFKGLHWPLFII